MIRTPKTLAAALALTAAIGLAACGGDDGGDEDPNEVLQATFSNEETVESGVFEVSVKLDAEGGENSGSLDASLGGPFDGTGDGFPKFDIDAEGELDTSLQDLSGNAGLTSTGDAGFVSFEDTEYEIPADAFTQFADSYTQLQQQTEQQAGGQGGNFLANIGIDPTNWLTDVSNEGDEDVEGTETIHISGQADVPKLVEDLRTIAENAPDAAQQVTPQQLRDLGELTDTIESADFDIYTGKDDDILRKFEASIDIAPPGGGEGAPDSVTLDFAITLSDINESQDIAAPSDPQPIQGLLDQLGVDPSALGGALGGGTGASATPQAGGSPEPVEPSASQAYLECLAEGGADAVERCESLRP